MLSLRKKLGVLLVACICGTGAIAVSASASAASSANAAFVVNHGTQVGDNCIATNGTDLYVGFITHLVVTSDGRFNIGCQLWGPEVSNVIDVDGLRIDPSGHATLKSNGVL